MSDRYDTIEIGGLDDGRFQEIRMPTQLPKCTEWDGQECKQGLRMECLYDKCEDCPHWTDMGCDGDLTEDEYNK